MPQVRWPLQNDRPVIEVVVPLPNGSKELIRCLIADTGAGNGKSVFQLVLNETDCIQVGGFLMGRVPLGGAYSGSFPMYLVQVRIPQLSFDQPVPVVAVSQVPPGFDGIACFAFLNRFQYGNFGDPSSFGLEYARGRRTFCSSPAFHAAKLLCLASRLPARPC